MAKGEWGHFVIMRVPDRLHEMGKAYIFLCYGLFGGGFFRGSAGGGGGRLRGGNSSRRVRLYDRLR